MTETFNEYLHQPPKYDIYGKQKEVYIIPGSDQRNILKDKNNIINPWDHQTNQENPIKSRTELISKRKLDRIPDKTYDLDGDGFVGGRDYVISKRFDVDKDGKLNAQEKYNAIEAIKNNIEDEYIWNLENQGIIKPARILQKRGKILDLENFLPLQDTYPRHPLQDNQPNFKTRTDLKENLKERTKKEIEDKTALWEKHNPKQIVKDYSNKKLNTLTPEFTSIKQIKENNRKLARENAGLEKEITDIKITNQDPSLAYVYNPEHKTISDLKERMRKENQDLSKKILSKKHIDEIERLRLREEEIFELGYYTGERLTHTKIKEQRRKENVDYNMKIFSNQTIGVHGQELPKFADAEEYKEFWKYKDDWIENPKYNSQVKLLEEQKFWKKPEELKINDHNDKIPEEKSKEHIPKNKTKELILKINKINHFKGFDPDNPQPIDIDTVKRKHIYRWTTLVNQFSYQKFKNGRFFDNLPTIPEHQTDSKAVFSSFNENGLYSSQYGSE